MANTACTGVHEHTDRFNQQKRQMQFSPLHEVAFLSDYNVQLKKKLLHFKGNHLSVIDIR